MRTRERDRSSHLEQMEAGERERVVKRYGAYRMGAQRREQTEEAGEGVWEGQDGRRSRDKGWKKQTNN